MTRTVNVLNLIFMTIIDDLLLCHVSWVIGIESGSKKIGSSQKYEVEKLAQYRWDIRYLLSTSLQDENYFCDRTTKVALYTFV